MIVNLASLATIALNEVVNMSSCLLFWFCFVVLCYCLFTKQVSLHVVELRRYARSHSS